MIWLVSRLKAWAQLELVAQYWSGYLPSAGEGGLLAGTPASTASSDACGRCCTSSRDVSHLLWGLDSHQSSARDLYLILLDFLINLLGLVTASHWSPHLPYLLACNSLKDDECIWTWNIYVIVVLMNIHKWI